MNKKHSSSYLDVKSYLVQRHESWLIQNDTQVLYQRFDQISRLNILLKLTKNIEGKILDIGCFDGFVAKQILDQGQKEVFGMDRLSIALERAAERGIQTRLGDIDDAIIDFPDTYFDGIVMGEVLDYLYDPDAVMKEIWRVLKTEGKLIITVPNLTSLGNRLRMLFGRPPRDLDVRPRQGGYWRYFTFKTLEDLLIDHGFTVLSKKSNAVAYPLFLVPGVRRVFPGDQLDRMRIFYTVQLARLFPTLGENIIIFAQKSPISPSHRRNEIL